MDLDPSVLRLMDSLGPFVTGWMDSPLDGRTSLASSDGILSVTCTACSIVSVTLSIVTLLSSIAVSNREFQITVYGER